MKPLFYPVVTLWLSSLALTFACSGGKDQEDRLPPEMSAGTGNHATAGANGSSGGPSAGAGMTPGGAGGAAGSEDPATGGEASTSAAPYAHVTAVTTSGSPAMYDFDVSIESADIDCSQYADWWEVLSEDGALLYRRILEHSHTDENGTSDPDAPGNTFTRDGGPVPVDAAAIVIVRAHMSNAGYNGRAMRGSAEAGFSDAPDLEPSFAAAVETEDPQPTGCLF
jgi:hypothetical protein